MPEQHYEERAQESNGLLTGRVPLKSTKPVAILQISSSVHPPASGLHAKSEVEQWN